MSRRDELAALLARRGRRTGRLGAVVLGVLVLMTVWGFGRAWHGGMAPVELTVGLVAGSITAGVAWRRLAPRGD